MKVFLTGATGFIGGRLAGLLNEGYSVKVLVRNDFDAMTFRKRGFETVIGDLSDRSALEHAIYGCEWVFHLAAYAKPASSVPMLPYRVNYEGTENLFRAAGTAGASRVIFTSTAGTMGQSDDGSIDEESCPEPVLHTEYERTKLMCEKLAKELSSERMQIVTVNPSRVFGPGRITGSNAVTKIIRLYCKGVWRIIPGTGESVGNYVYVDDVARGLILAARHGRGGERYILGGENLSFNRFFELLSEVSGKKRIMIRLSKENLKLIARLTGYAVKLAGKPPVLTSGWIEKYLGNAALSIAKAERELSYKTTPFREAAGITVKWLNEGSKKGFHP